MCLSSRVCPDPADPHFPSKCLSLFLKFVVLLEQTPFLQGRRSNQTIPRGWKRRGEKRAREGEETGETGGYSSLASAGTCGSPLLLPSSESDCCSASLPSPLEEDTHVMGELTADAPAEERGFLRVLRPGSRRRPPWSASSRGAACVPVWSGPETCPRPPSPPLFCRFLPSRKEKHGSALLSFHLSESPEVDPPQTAIVRRDPAVIPPSPEAGSGK